jgi:Uma2 family endonuclease
VAAKLDLWNQTADCCEVLNNPGFQFRLNPPTLIQVPLAILDGRYPTLVSNWLNCIPRVVVEITLGRERCGDVWERIEEYLDCGVKAVWVINPYSRTVTVHRPGEAAFALDTRDPLRGEPDLPGFSCPVADLFR